jgi:hypothetical protein
MMVGSFAMRDLMFPKFIAESEAILLIISYILHNCTIFMPDKGYSVLFNSCGLSLDLLGFWFYDHYRANLIALCWKMKFAKNIITIVVSQCSPSNIIHIN